MPGSLPPPPTPQLHSHLPQLPGGSVLQDPLQAAMRTADSRMSEQQIREFLIRAFLAQSTGTS